MRAVVVERFTSPSDLRVAQVEEPRAARGQVLIEVRAAGCNFFDTLLVQGKYQVKPPFPFFPGGEVAGVVREVGRDVTDVSPGDRVVAHVGHGGFAELCCSDERATFRMPPKMTFEQGAALPIAYGTAYVGIVLRGAVLRGECILVTAAAGGVGLAAIQIAKAIGARVIGAASGDKLEVVRSVGADDAVDYRDPEWAGRVRDKTEGRGVNAVLENVGGEVFDACLKCIAWGGRLVVCGFSSGSIPEVRMNRVLLKHIALLGLHFGPMFEHEPAALRAAFSRMFTWYEAGEFEPLVFKTYPLEEAAAAVSSLKSRDTVGKVVLTL